MISSRSVMQYRKLSKVTDPVINRVLLKGLASKKMEDGLQEQSDYVISKLPAEDKKGF